MHARAGGRPTGRIFSVFLEGKKKASNQSMHLSAWHNNFSEFTPWRGAASLKMLLSLLGCCNGAYLILIQLRTVVRFGPEFQHILFWGSTEQCQKILSALRELADFRAFPLLNFPFVTEDTQNLLMVPTKKDLLIQCPSVQVVASTI